MCDLYLMSGPAGVGKTTYLKNHAKQGSRVISRDRIRFRMVKENEEYFSREDDVFKLFVNEIRWAMVRCSCVYVDATLLTKKSRMKLLTKLNLDKANVHIIYFDIPLAVALNQNGRRKGRERVPDAVVANMYDTFEKPENDNINYKTITIVKRGDD